MWRRRPELLDHHREGADVAEVTPHKEDERGHGLEHLFEHERVPVAIRNLDLRISRQTDP